MKKFHLSDAVPPMPERYARKMAETLNTLGQAQSPRVRHGLRPALIAALIAALTLAGAAFAASRSGLLDEFFAGRAPREDAQALLAQGTQAQEERGLRLALDEYILNGDELAIGWSIERTGEPVLVTGYASASVDGQALAWDGSSVPIAGLRYLGGALDDKALSDETFLTKQFTIPEALLGQRVEITLIAQRYRPVVPCLSQKAAGIEGYPGFEEGMYGQSEALVFDEQGFTDQYGYVRANERVTAYWEALAGASDGELADYSKYTEYDALCELGYLERLPDAVLTATVEPAAGPVSHTRVAGQDTFEFEDYTLKVAELDLSAVQSRWELRLIPKRPLKEQKDWNDEPDPMERSYVLLDEEGVKLDFAGGGAGGAPNRREEDGQVVIVCAATYGPVSRIPETVTLMPTNDQYMARPKRWSEPGYEPTEAEKEAYYGRYYAREDAVTVRLERVR